MDKVLIVEDDPMVALINKRYLQQFRQIEIFGPVMYEEEVLSYLEAQKIDLIIMDVFLPKKSGLEILKTIREKEYTVLSLIHISYVGMGRVYPFLHATNEILELSNISLPLASAKTTTPKTRL